MLYRCAFFLVLAVLNLGISVSTGLTASAATPKIPNCNPAPAEGDFTLPMPNGLSMVFRPVFLGSGDGPYGLRRITIGGNGENFKEHPTAVAIGGAFIAERNGHQDWLYYIGKFEVMEAQFASIVGSSSHKRPEGTDGTYPAVNLSYHEIERFIDGYNQWLHANALDKLPKYSGVQAFIRLPTEAEWEFAARGGCEVNQDRFDRRTPYADNLSDYEWFAGPTSSHNKIQPVGQLKPNQLFLHDMLGNAAEVTASLYQLEYYQGRVGGFVAKGGSYMTNEGEIRSSIRSEQPFYASRNPGESPTPYRREDMGFRLAISSLVIPTMRASSDLEKAWDEYRNGPGKINPAALSTSPDETRVGAQKEELGVHVERLKNSLESAGHLSGQAADELKLVESKLSDIVAIRRQASLDSACAWVRTTAGFGYFIVDTLDKISSKHVLIKLVENRISAGGLSAEDLKKDQYNMESYRRQLAELEDSLRDQVEAYSDAQRQLARLSPEFIQKGFDEYRRGLESKKAGQRQLALVEVTAAHAKILAESGRADPDLWLNSFRAVIKKPQ